MKLKVWIKANLADKALSCLRAELVELIDSESSVLDIGCGTGDLLFKAAYKLSYGFGVDLDADMINFANRKCEDNQISNLAFESNDAKSLNLPQFNIATSTLCLHEMNEKEACTVLRIMAEKSEKVLVADYATPKSFLVKLGIEFDEIISGHYRAFRRYRNAGGISEYARKLGLKINRTIPSAIDGIVIWEIYS
ncbi:class I SAM-dependent methyltransferase [Catenovulum sediminis]|uniref:class I SAM-dependent methyltransferase n=1 Tax=Catenovulum sediminis TaxID=1740262 RepID=UPI001180D993|nr:class I SAM-dependent methyltransferase [Catenovulum sediminis]